MNIRLPVLGECVVDGPQPILGPGARVLIGCSVKNRSFKSSLVRSCLECVTSLGCELCIVIFDRPYAYNDAAARHSADPTSQELIRARRVGDEKTAMIERLVRHYPNIKCTMRRWDECNEVASVRALREEFVRGLASDELRNVLVNQMRDRLSVDGWIENEWFLNFQIQEIPVLVDLYYRQGFLIDLYPGSNFPFFGQLERGVWNSCLPFASSLAKEKALSFVNVLGKV